MHSHMGSCACTSYVYQHVHACYVNPHAQELDCNNIKMLQEPSRITRLARGSGRSPGEVMHLIEVSHDSTVVACTVFLLLSMTTAHRRNWLAATCFAAAPLLIVLPMSSRFPLRPVASAGLCGGLLILGCAASGRHFPVLPSVPQAYKHYSKYATQALKAANLPKNLKNFKGDIPMNPRHMQQSLQKMGAALPPQLLNQLGGMSGLSNLMKSMDGKGGFPGMGRMK